LARHQERRGGPLEHRAGEDREPGATGPDVLAHRSSRRAPLSWTLLLPLLQRSDVRQQPGQQRLVDAVGVDAVALPDRARRGPKIDLHLLADLTQLGLEVLPLTDPQVVEELPLAHPTEGTGG